MHAKVRLLRSRYLVLWVAAAATIGCVSQTGEGWTVANVETMDVPSRAGGMPNLHTSATGATYLSWVEFVNDSTDALQYSVLNNSHWGKPRQIASGTDWFVNWADFPSLITYASEEMHIAAHWLEMSGDGTYDYDIRIAQSRDGGGNWEPSFIPHRDNIRAEHGFVTLLPLGSDRILATWLDGRFAATAGTGAHSEHTGAMTLRVAEFDIEGRLYAQAQLDERVCDCCQTSAVVVDDGVLVAYRDRSEEEIRDISVVSFRDGQWSSPVQVHDDQWKLAGCPVNGPAIDASGALVALAWFTAALDTPRVQVAFSGNAGQSFDDPIQIDGGNPLGRVDLVMYTDSIAAVTWMEYTERDAEIRLALVHAGGEVLLDYALVPTSAERRSGFPRLTRAGNDLIIAWTRVAGDLSMVSSARITFARTHQ